MVANGSADAKRRSTCPQCVTRVHPLDDRRWVVPWSLVLSLLGRCSALYCVFVRACELAALPVFVAVEARVTPLTACAPDAVLVACAPEGFLAA